MNLPSAHLCRVCGYFSEEPPWGLDGCCPTYAYCPCCGVEWGYQDSLPTSADRFRANWLQRGGIWEDRAVPPDGLTTNERLHRLGIHAEKAPITGLDGEIIFHPRSAGGRRSGPPTAEDYFPTATVLAPATGRGTFSIRVHLAHFPSATQRTPCTVSVLVPGAPGSEAVIAGAQLLVYEGPHVVGQLRILGSADETNAHASGIVRWASAEIASLCVELGGILDPAVLRDVADLADHAEPGIALGLICDGLDASSPLDVALRSRLLTVGRAMGLDETVAFLGDARTEG
ncbi:hypothetical protein MTES_3400 [Microbacterium testaceum StLB037]|uniref:Uncharacterized protein n=1 Tax=Microbacterium testaceum (strain StLB037) TaxID=979556 RepID=E8NEB0_MICTS|nr:hypothetical protein [Microbacterium testaceum]BAJ76364.1 hypothetical protein MTES_3400 [Microbacterium testaceum StLB037]